MKDLHTEYWLTPHQITVNYKKSQETLILEDEHLRTCNVARYHFTVTFEHALLQIGCPHSSTTLSMCWQQRWLTSTDLRDVMRERPPKPKLPHPTLVSSILLNLSMGWAWARVIILLIWCQARQSRQPPQRQLMQKLQGVD